MSRPIFALALLAISLSTHRGHAELLVGTAVVDVTPAQFPVLVNGGMLTRSVSEVHTKVNARAIVVADGKEKIALVVVDSCMLPRPLLDETKQLAANQTDIRPDRMMISATHTHSAPSALACLGTDADPNYVPYLRIKLADAIVQANKKLEPAKVGWGSIDANEFTALRRWIRRSDRPAEDPFGNFSVRANMHAGRVADDVTGESGPEDPELSLISFQSKSGRPLAVLANFSMHYFGDKALGADYFGLFCEGFKKEVVGEQEADAKQEPEFIAIMSHGCSGDIWRRDYNDADFKEPKIDEYTQGLLERALVAYREIKYQGGGDLAMSEARLQLAYRLPDKQRLEWAQRIVEAMGDQAPKNTTEVYAKEQIILHERQQTEIVVQALRIGDIAIATTPNETYALTGLKVKHQSPLPKTMVIELANGGDGYIPPPEQHRLGGYNTWAARSAGLEVTAEPKIVASALTQLEAVCNQPRRPFRLSVGSGAKAILDLSPVAYYRLDEFSGPQVIDHSGAQRHAVYESDVVYFLEGPLSSYFCAKQEVNRSAHFAGGRITTTLPDLKDQYSISLWFWNGMPLDSRPVLGWMFSKDFNFGTTPSGLHLGLGGMEDAGKLLLCAGDPANPQNMKKGTTRVKRWDWNHCVLVRDGASVKVYLNGELEIEQNTEPGKATAAQCYFGGRSDNVDNWEGRLDEIALFTKALTAGEVKKLTAR